VSSFEWVRPTIGISACLLGERVRHDGEHKRNDWLVNQLGKYVNWVPICPEVEMGLGIPRETIRMEGSHKNVSLLTVKSRRDLTRLAADSAQKILDRLHNLNAFVLKKGSPSCGVERVKIYGRNSSPSRDGMGFFVSALTKKFPDLPLIDEGRLSDLRQRERFVTLVFAAARLRALEPRVPELQKFHEIYKLLLMSYSPDLYRRLGQVAANSEKRAFADIRADYEKLLIQLFKEFATSEKRVNVLQHVFGYFSDRLDANEKAVILECIEDFRKGWLPFVAPLTLLYYLSRKFKISYLEEQVLFNPYPRGLLGSSNFLLAA